MKPGWQTSEFWVTCITQVLAIMVGAGVVPQGDSPSLSAALQGIVNGAAAVIASAAVVVTYIMSRTRIKATAPTPVTEPPANGGVLLPSLLAMLCLGALASTSSAQAVKPAPPPKIVASQEEPVRFEVDKDRKFVKITYAWTESVNTGPPVYVETAYFLPWRQRMEEKIKAMGDSGRQQQQAPAPAIPAPAAPAPIIIMIPAPAPALQTLPIAGQPLQQLPIQGQPLQQLPINGQPLQQLPIQGQPQQKLPIQGQPQQQLPLDLTPQQKLPVQPPAVPIMPPSSRGPGSWGSPAEPPNGYQRFTCEPKAKVVRALAAPVP